ncbi:MAG: LamG domain-containing protein, partial [Tepidisphaeraceae bacterium]
MQPLEARRLLAQTGFWTFDDGSGATAIDSSGSNTNAVGYKMTLSNAPAWQSTGVDGGSLAFSTATQYGDAGPLPGSAATLSVSLWFNASSLKNQTLVDKLPNDASGAGWAIKLRSDGSLWFRIGSAGNFTDVKVAGAYSAGSWTAVAATFTGGTAALFVNGQSRATQGGITQSVANATTPLRVAVPSASSTTETFAGAIDDLRLWDQVISPTSIAREYAVDQLPAATTANRLKKADLQWAIEDALADEAYGNTASAANTYADVLTMLAQNIGNARPSPANLFPVIPSASTNPILADAMVKLNKLRTNYAHLDKN